MYRCLGFVWLEKQWVVGGRRMKCKDFHICAIEELVKHTSLSSSFALTSLSLHFSLVLP
jgi:hypothetical protein